MLRFYVLRSPVQGNTPRDVAIARRQFRCVEALDAGAIQWLPKPFRKPDPRHPRPKRLNLDERIAVDVLNSANLYF